MEPRSSKPNSRPTVRRPTGDTNRDSVKDLPLNASDAFLGPPQRPDEIGWLGPYRILGVIGRGGMGAVYRAEDPRLKRQLAIKVLLPELAADARAKARFRREAQAQAQVDHDNIIPIFEVEEANGVVYIAMPLLRGQTLGAALKQNSRPPIAELVRIGREIAEGLAAAHAVGLIHRDIKPGNIWLEGSKRRVKILDFGLARSDKTFDAKNDAITAANAIMGTPAYMAPEQARSQPTDKRSDIFSLGVVLYEMATGQKPFGGESAFDIMAEVVSKEPPPVQSVVPEFPAILSDLIQRMLAKNPAQRPPSCESVAAELQAIENSLTMLPVVVVPLSESPGVPDVWADIETTYAESIVTPRTREHDERAPLPKWLWPAVGGVACLALVAVIAVAFPWSKPKQQEVVQEPTPTPKPKVNPQPKPKDTPLTRDKRLVADWVLKQRNGEQKSTVTIQLNGAAEKLTITDNEKLPATSFTVVGVSLAHLNDADEPQLANVVGALEDLDSLAFKGAAWTDARLTTAINALKGRKINRVEISGVTDALPFAMNALLYLRITALEISTTAADGVPVQNLNRIVGLQRASLGQVVTNTSLSHFSKLTSWPKSISFRGNPGITDQGLEAIETSKLRQNTAIAFDFRETGVTEIGVKKLAERFSHSTVQWNGGTVGPLVLERQRTAAQTARDRGASVMLFGNKYVTTSADIVAPDSFRTLVFATGTHTNHLTPSAKGAWESALTGTITKPFTAEELAVLLPNMPCQEIWLCGQAITDEGGAKLLSQLAPEGVVVLKITNCDVADQTAKAVASLPALTFLGFDNTKLTDVGVKHLVGRLPKLTALRLANTQLTNDAIPDLGQFALLHNLDLKGTQITEAGANKLAKLLPRTWIRYGTGTVIEPKSNVVADRKAAEWVVSVGGAVKVNGAPSTTMELTVFAELPKDPIRLTYVRMSPNDKITNESVAIFQDCTELTALGLESVAISDEGLLHFRNAKKLTHLYLSRTGTTNAGLAVFQDCEQLLSLGLAHTKIDDDSIPVLSGFKLLQQLDITGTRITEDGVEKLQAALPSCVILPASGMVTKPTHGLRFDGKSTFVSVKALRFDGNLPITLEAWITPETVNDGKERHICLLGEPGGGMGLSKNGAFGVGFYDGKLWHNDYTRTQLKAGETVHVAAVVTKDRITLFINGKDSGGKDVNLGKLPLTQAPSLIGKPTKDASGEFFHGTIHGLRISKTARYTKDFTPPPLLGTDAETIANYQFRDAGKRLTDTTKAALHGDIENGTWTGNP